MVGAPLAEGWLCGPVPGNPLQHHCALTNLSLSIFVTLLGLIFAALLILVLWSCCQTFILWFRIESALRHTIRLILNQQNTRLRRFSSAPEYTRPGSRLPTASTNPFV
uniref:Nonstructural protein NS12 n=1 Tax=Grass carp reovirus TaxID=128987 RepID=A0A3Q8VPI4_GCRV|nr:nonstructural protein NS12 [Grass carp reovirus]